MQLVQNTQPAIRRDRLLPIDEVEKLTGLKKTSLYRLMKLGRFPRNVRLSTKCVRWGEQSVLTWVQDRLTEAAAQGILEAGAGAGAGADAADQAALTRGNAPSTTLAAQRPVRR